eukprot:TRINITY_DN25147_c0_g1_i1.p1 TRINITY_DN25147_c0_g1~~TRINITY_DN25147_c0_g1_i1.p1  ORF type:complete len:767 (+),score=142.82 TRINITY_DN25147_c0_g1_i1:83-2302(+)
MPGASPPAGASASNSPLVPPVSNTSAVTLTPSQVPFQPTPKLRPRGKSTRLPPAEAVDKNVRGYMKLHEVSDRLHRKTRAALRPREMDRVRQKYAQSSGLSSVKAIRNILMELGQSVCDDELHQMLELVQYVPGQHLSFDRLLHIIEMLKQRAFDAVVPDTVEAFAALGGAKDKTGEIDTSRLKNECDRFRLTIDIDAMIREVDKDGSGQLDFAEFAAMFDGDGRPQGKARRQQRWPAELLRSSSVADVLVGTSAGGAKPQDSRRHLPRAARPAELRADAAEHMHKERAELFARSPTLGEDDVEDTLEVMSRVFEAMQRDIDDRQTASRRQRALAAPVYTHAMAAEGRAAAAASGVGCGDMSRRHRSRSSARKPSPWVGRPCMSKNVAFIGADRAPPALGSLRVSTQRKIELPTGWGKTQPRRQSVAGGLAESRMARKSVAGEALPRGSVHQGHSGSPVPRAHKTAPPPLPPPPSQSCKPERLRPASALSPEALALEAKADTQGWPRGRATLPPRFGSAAGRVAGAPRSICSMQQHISRTGPVSVRADFSYRDFLAATPSFIGGGRDNTVAASAVRAAERARRLQAARGHPTQLDENGFPVICEAARLALCGMHGENAPLSPRVHAGAQDQLLAAAQRASSNLGSPKRHRERDPYSPSASPTRSPGVDEKRQLLLPRPNTSVSRQARTVQSPPRFRSVQPTPQRHCPDQPSPKLQNCPPSAPCPLPPWRPPAPSSIPAM